VIRFDFSLFAIFLSEVNNCVSLLFIDIYLLMLVQNVFDLCNRVRVVGSVRVLSRTNFMLGCIEQQINNLGRLIKSNLDVNLGRVKRS